jgi:hypothetical protein
MSAHYLLIYWQPLTGLTLGIVMVFLYFYLYATRKKALVPWVARYVFRNQAMSEKSADSLVKVLASYLFMFGGLIIILALLYLAY